MLKSAQGKRRKRSDSRPVATGVGRAVRAVRGRRATGACATISTWSRIPIGVAGVPAKRGPQSGSRSRLVRHGPAGVRRARSAAGVCARRAAGGLVVRKGGGDASAAEVLVSALAFAVR